MRASSSAGRQASRRHQAVEQETTEPRPGIESSVGGSGQQSRNGESWRSVAM